MLALEWTNPREGERSGGRERERMDENRAILGWSNEQRQANEKAAAIP